MTGIPKLGVALRPEASNEETVAKVTEAMDRMVAGDESDADRELLRSATVITHFDLGYDPRRDPFLLTVVPSRHRRL